jgi:4,5-dihydroxyphthalate decarboxylase
MTAAVWVRGFLMSDYGVRPEDINWVIGRPVRTIKPPEGIHCEFMRPDTTLEAMLERGEIDALASVMIPKALGTTMRRLFSDPRKVEREYYERTRIFPIMHTFVLKKALYDENPWLAISFYRAFCRARDIAYYWMNDTDALTISLPWVIDELEATRKIFGPQVWDYSIEGSRPTLDALVRHLDEQKLTRRKMTVEELFVPNISPGLAEYLHATAED